MAAEPSFETELVSAGVSASLFAYIVYATLYTYFNMLFPWLFHSRWAKVLQELYRVLVTVPGNYKRLAFGPRRTHGQTLCRAAPRYTEGQ